MELVELINELKEHKNGRLLKIKYQTEVPVSAKAKQSGYTVSKVTESVTRIGCRYTELKSVKERLLADPTYVVNKGKPGYEVTFSRNQHVIITHNTNKDKYYLYTQPIPGNRHTHSEYKIFKNNKHIGTVTKQDIMHMDLIIPSYFTTNNYGVVRDICIDNIIAIIPKRIK